MAPRVFAIRMVFSACPKPSHTAIPKASWNALIASSSACSPTETACRSRPGWMGPVVGTASARSRYSSGVWHRIVTPSRCSRSSRCSASKEPSWITISAPHPHGPRRRFQPDSAPFGPAVHQTRSPGRASSQCSAGTRCAQVEPWVWVMPICPPAFDVYRMTAASSAAVSCVGCRIGVFRSSVATSSAITTSSGTSIKATALARSRSVTMSRAPESSARHARSPVCTSAEHGTTTNPPFSAPSRIATHVGVLAVKTSRRSPGTSPRLRSSAAQRFASRAISVNVRRSMTPLRSTYVSAGYSGSAA